jgi:hypothetical protein
MLPGRGGHVELLQVMRNLQNTGRVLVTNAEGKCGREAHQALVVHRRDQRPRPAQVLRLPHCTPQHGPARRGSARHGTVLWY